MRSNIAVDLSSPDRFTAVQEGFCPTSVSIMLSFLLFPFYCLGLIHLKTHIWRLRHRSVGFSPSHKSINVSHSFKPPNVIRLFPGCGQEADTSSFPVTCLRCQRRGLSSGGRGGGRAGCRAFVVKGNGARCRWGFPCPKYVKQGRGRPTRLSAADQS